MSHDLCPICTNYTDDLRSHLDDKHLRDVNLAYEIVEYFERGKMPEAWKEPRE